MFSVITCQFSQSVSRSEALHRGRNEKTEYSERKKVISTGKAALKCKITTTFWILCLTLSCFNWSNVSFDSSLRCFLLLFALSFPGKSAHEFTSPLSGALIKLSIPWVSTWKDVSACLTQSQLRAQRRLQSNRCIRDYESRDSAAITPAQCLWSLNYSELPQIK